MLLPSMSASLLILSLSLRTIAASTRCYYPNGDYQPNDTPCDPDAKQSNCCAPDDICLSNGLCWRANINRLHRGSCTDPTFSSPHCTTICTSPNDIATGWADVLECPLSNNDWYCGWGNQSRCQDGQTFQIPDGYFADYRNGSGSGVSSASETAVAGVTVTETETVSVTATATAGVVGDGGCATSSASGSGSSPSLPANESTSTSPAPVAAATGGLSPAVGNVTGNATATIPPSSTSLSSSSPAVQTASGAAPGPGSGIATSVLMLTMLWVVGIVALGVL